MKKKTSKKTTEEGVLIEGGDVLFVDNAEGFARLNLAMPGSVIRTAMERIKTAIRS